MRFVSCATRAIFVCAAACAFASCGAGGTVPTAPNAADARTMIEGVRRDPSGGKIKHVVIIVQENRSFNNLFLGVPGATTQDYGYDSKGKKVSMHPIPLETVWDIDHSSSSFLAACNGTGSYPGTDCRMNGFDKELWYCGSHGEPRCPDKYPPYSYVPRSETKPYFEMAKYYTLADQMFASNFDGSSFISHQYIIAAQASSAVNYPGGAWGCSQVSDEIQTVTQQRQLGGYEPVCFNNKTLGDELDQAHQPWAFYAAALCCDGEIWSAYQAIKHIRYGKDWKKDVISPQTNFFSDVSKGKLRTVSWITPTCATSDHAGCGGNQGPAWVASLVNAVGESKYWDSTAIVVFWDDYGGWYDPVAPAMVDYDGLGMRIPMLVISAYSKKGYVSHVPYEHGSILRFIEDEYALARLSASDSRANSIAPDCFDFKAPPRKFQKITAPLDANFFLHAPPDGRAPDSQ
jgi:phospholipase C